MTQDLTVADFSRFFEEIHGHLPFPWQIRLIQNLAAENKWPEVLDLPTGSGKTAALDVAVFHLALEAHRGSERRAAVRIALVVDRRLVVDDAFGRANKIAEALANARPETVTAQVAQRLRLLAGENSPALLAHRLRGGIPREDDWARTPSQPTILCSTVDQVGSRLLFRGYGVSNSMKPVHAGLIGADCIILLDEAHLSEPFRQTLGWVKHYKGASWRETSDTVAPWDVALLTATPGTEEGSRFHLQDDDYENLILGRRWKASKPALLITPIRAKNPKTAETGDENKEPAKGDDSHLITEIVSRVTEGLETLEKGGLNRPALAVVINRVARARAVFEELRDKYDAETIDLILMIGPARPVDRDALAGRLNPIRTGSKRDLKKPFVIVSTQCIEAGVDIDLDGLITEAAPIDALRQRFGRLNRDGRNIAPYAAIIGGKADPRDPVYGVAIGNAWKYLTDNPVEHVLKGKDAMVDFGLAAFQDHSNKYPISSEMLSPKPDAPVLLPAHLDLLSQTAPIPAADPEVALYLHGPGRASDSISVVWRADVEPHFQDTYRLLQLVPPRAAEVIELPIWTVRRWLTEHSPTIDTLADIAVSIPDENESSRKDGREQTVFRWTGDQDSSAWIRPKDIHSGDTLIVAAAYGGIDEYGWKPDSPEPVEDVGHRAAEPFASRRFAVRVGPGLLKRIDDESLLAQALANSDTRRWKYLRDAVNAIALPESIAETLNNLDLANGKVEAYTDVYGDDEQGRPRGVVFLAQSGIKGRTETEDTSTGTTEDDIAGSLSGSQLSLQQHSTDVERTVDQFAKLAGLLADRVLDLKLAGHLHDAGKADARFQKWMSYGDPLGPDPNCLDEILAKSSRPLPPTARTHSGLPEHWRHEALSVRLAPLTPRFDEAKDPELVLWLVGTHHGHGRPFFPHCDPEDTQMRSNFPAVLGIPQTLPPGPGPQSLAYDRNGLDWPNLYEQLKTRYGIWELARMEAILRLSDHRASQAAEHSRKGEEQ
ncbi:MAG: type I-G CRISPR-associated helicase/endonuclease Cas3g [Acidobacteriaceae bacterium]